MGFKFAKMNLEGAYIIDCFFVGDNRGGFSKYYERDTYKESGIDFNPNETFLSYSSRNVVRGLHFQLNRPQAKLVTVVSGCAWDVIVDLRPNSKTFKQVETVELSSENKRVVYIPKGFAHGFLALADHTAMLYQCEGKYDKETDTGIRFDCPEIGIKWPIAENDMILSERDLKLKSFQEYIKNPMII